MQLGEQHGIGRQMGLEPQAKLFTGNPGGDQPVTREHAAGVQAVEGHGSADRGRRATRPPALRPKPAAQSVEEPQQAGLDAIRRRARYAVPRG